MKDKSHKKVSRKKERKSFKEWRKTHRKTLLIVYYAVAAIVIVVNIGIILNNITITEVVERDEDIAFSTDYVDDGNLELWVEEVEREGVNGRKKVYYNERKKWLSGEVLESDVENVETEEEPISQVVRRGTRKWQYMYCSDNTYMYYTDEQFQNTYTGFTHSSEDQCASSGHGSMTALADSPLVIGGGTNPVSSSGSSSYTPVYADLSTLDYINDYSEYDLPASEDNNDSKDYYESAEKYAQQARIAAENACMSKASSAGRSLRSQLGALGQPADIVDSRVSSLINSTYQSCMREYGY